MRRLLLSLLPPSVHRAVSAGRRRMGRERSWMSAYGAFHSFRNGYRAALFEYFLVDSASRFFLFRRLQALTGARVFIESGTFHGVTARNCSMIFDTVFTIELDSTLAGNARTYLSDCTSVTVIEGDAVAVLPTLLERPDVDQVMIFLDGHYSGEGTAHGDVAEPAPMELEIIARWREKVRAIIIDDFRLFGVETGFPSKAMLFDTIGRLFETQGWTVSVHWDQVVMTSPAIAPERIARRPNWTPRRRRRGRADDPADSPLHPRARMVMHPWLGGSCCCDRR